MPESWTPLSVTTVHTCQYLCELAGLAQTPIIEDVSLPVPEGHPSGQCQVCLPSRTSSRPLCDTQLSFQHYCFLLLPLTLYSAPGSSPSLPWITHLLSQIPHWVVGAQPCCWYSCDSIGGPQRWVRESLSPEIPGHSYPYITTHSNLMTMTSSPPSHLPAAPR